MCKGEWRRWGELLFCRWSHLNGVVGEMMKRGQLAVIAVACRPAWIG
jgi:hypothetical protein